MQWLDFIIDCTYAARFILLLGEFFAVDPEMDFLTVNNGSLEFCGFWKLARIFALQQLVSL